MEVVGRESYQVTLSDEERNVLLEIQRGKGAARTRLRAQILIPDEEDREDGGLNNAAIASVLIVGSRTVERIRQRGVIEGVEAAVERRASRRTGSLGSWTARQKRSWLQQRVQSLVRDMGIWTVVHSDTAEQGCRVGDRRQHWSGDGAVYAEENDVEPWPKQYSGRARPRGSDGPERSGRIVSDPGTVGRYGRRFRNRFWQLPAAECWPCCRRRGFRVGRESSCRFRRGIAGSDIVFRLHQGDGRLLEHAQARLPRYVTPVVRQATAPLRRRIRRQAQRSRAGHGGPAWQGWKPHEWEAVTSC